MEINLQTFLARTGYGIAGLNIAKALSNLGVKINAHSIGGQIHVNNIEERQLVEKILANGEFFSYDCPSLKICHQHLFGEHYGKGLYIGMPIFELNRFTKVEKHNIGFLDRVYVNSHWAKEVVEQNVGRKDVIIIPLGIDPSIFNAQNKDENNRESKNRDKPYVFLNIGKMTINKGHDILPKVFNSAFDITNNVELWMVPHNPFYTPQEMNDWINLYKNTNIGHKIKIIPPLTTHQDIANLMRSADCGIFPSRGEGVNLELLEMLSLGKPCIATNYSGHTEYCTKDNTYLIDIENLEDAYDGKWFNGQGQWAALESNQIEQCVEHMIYCYKNHPDNPAGIKTGIEFTWENSAKKIINDLF